MLYRDETIGDVRRVKLHFDSQIEAADYLLNTTPKWADCTASRTGHRNEYSWDFCLGWQGTQQLARTGWSEGAKDLGDRLAVHMPERDHVDAWRYDVAGELPDVGRYLAGDPVHMRRHGHPKGHKPIISIFVNNWIVCSTTAQQAANYGAAITSLIDQLENSGRRVELTVGTIAQHFRHGNTMMSATWRVKAAEDPLDLAAVAFAIAHPAASRRFGWSLWETTDAPMDKFYGVGMGRIAEEADLIDPFPGTLMINGIKMDGGRCNALDAALAFAAGQINAAAGETLVTVEG